MPIHKNDIIRFLDSVRVRQQGRKRIECLNWATCAFALPNTAKLRRGPHLGKVIQVDEENKLVWVETDDGFDVGPIPASSVVPVSTQDDYLHLKHPAFGAKPSAKATTPPAPAESQPHVAVSKRSQRQSNELVLDLHIDALPTNGSGMTDVEKHKYQLQYFRMQMQLAFSNRVALTDDRVVIGATDASALPITA